MLFATHRLMSFSFGMQNFYLKNYRIYKAPSIDDVERHEFGCVSKPPKNVQLVFNSDKVFAVRVKDNTVFKILSTTIEDCRNYVCGAIPVGSLISVDYVGTADELVEVELPAGELSDLEARILRVEKFVQELSKYSSLPMF